MFKFKRLHSLLRFPVHLILVISILFALLPVVTAASTNGTISGYVSDNSTSNPIADADILVF